MERLERPAHRSRNLAEEVSSLLKSMRDSDLATNKGRRHSGKNSRGACLQDPHPVALIEYIAIVRSQERNSCEASTHGSCVLAA